MQKIKSCNYHQNKKTGRMLLTRAIKSVLSQSYGNWTHVIINDSENKNKTK
ncbi:MAG: hypothetical protein HC906_18525 [Bacteroidales bacterium]|nr:hypothetical protein [Bacteroidales bacterium]